MYGSHCSSDASAWRRLKQSGTAYITSLWPYSAAETFVFIVQQCKE
jgi:hypothetical protein